MATETYVYLDKEGIALPPGKGRAARYKIEGMADGQFVLMEKHKSRWDMVCSGKLVAVARLQAFCDYTEPTYYCASTSCPGACL